MEFGSRVRSLARTELAALARSLYHRERMPVEAAEAISSAAGALIEGKLGVASSEWFSAELRSVQRGQLRYRGGAIQKIEERARTYKREASRYVRGLREKNKAEVELLRQQMDLSLGSAESLNLPSEEKRQLRRDFRRRIAARSAITRALNLGLRSAQHHITSEATAVEEQARRALSGGRRFLGATKTAKFTASLFESVGGLAASLLRGGGTAAFFQTAGRAAGGVIETGGLVAAEATEQASIGAGKLLGLAAGAAISKITGDPSMVRAGMKMGGKVGDTVGSLVGAGIRGVSSMLASMFPTYGAQIGKSLEQGVKSWAIYDEAKQKLTAMGAGSSLDTARAKGYVSEQAKVAATAYLSAIGDDRMFSEFLSVGRMYGVPPSALAETLNIYKFAGGTRQGENVSLRGLYRRVAALTQQPGMGGYGRSLEVFRATSKLAGAVGAQRDAMTEEDMTALIGTQAWIGQLGEGYGGLRGVDVLSKLNKAIRGEGGVTARALGIAEVGSAEEYIEYQRRKEAGLAEPANLHRLVSQVVKEWGTGLEGIGTLKEISGLRIEQARNIMGLVEEKGLESLTVEALEEIAKTDEPRREMIGGGEAFAVEMESMGIKIGAAGHEMVYTIKKTQAKMAMAMIKAMRGDTNGLPELLDEIAEYFNILLDVVGAFFTILEKLIGISFEESASWPEIELRIAVEGNAQAFWDEVLNSAIGMSPNVRVGNRRKWDWGGRDNIVMTAEVHPRDTVAFFDWIVAVCNSYSGGRYGKIEVVTDAPTLNMTPEDYENEWRIETAEMQNPGFKESMDYLKATTMYGG